MYTWREETVRPMDITPCDQRRLPVFINWPAVPPRRNKSSQPFDFLLGFFTEVLLIFLATVFLALRAAVSFIDFLTALLDDFAAVLGDLLADFALFFFSAFLSGRLAGAFSTDAAALGRNPPAPMPAATVTTAVLAKSAAVPAARSAAISVTVLSSTLRSPLRCPTPSMFLAITPPGKLQSLAHSAAVHNPHHA